MSELAVYDNDPTLYLFTSLTAGSSHIVTATSRIETILKANKIPFQGVDTATDDLARKLYGRRAGGRKLPLLVKEGYVIADLEQIEEWNEYDELKDVLGAPPAPAPTKPTPAVAAAAASAPAPNPDTEENTPSANPEQNLAIRQLGAEAAKVAAAKKTTPANIATTNPLLSEKVNSPAVSSPSGLLSPRSVPLPATPNPATSTPQSPAAAEAPTSTPKSPAAAEAPTSTPKSPAAAEALTSTPKSPVAEEVPTSTIPKLESKPVHSPPSMHADASNPTEVAAPISSPTVKSPTAPKSPSASIKSPPMSPGGRDRASASPVTELHGHKVGTPPKEEIKKIEDAEAIAEVSSTEEEDSEEERVKTAKKAGVEEVKVGSDEEESGEESVRKAEVEAVKVESEEKGEVKTQEQDAKNAEKAGESVKD